METLRAEIEITGKPVALFDIDNTLIRGFTIFPFANLLLQERLIESLSVSQMLTDLHEYENERLDYHTFALDVVDHYCQGLKGSSKSAVEAASRTFLHQHLKNLMPYSKSLIDIMNRQGISIAISGAPREAFTPLANHLKLAHTFLLEAETDSDVYTGKVKTNMALKEEKDKVISMLTQQTYDRSNSFAFGDSTSDLPILEAVGNPFAVLPNPELRRIALEKDWQIVAEEDILDKVQSVIKNSS